MLRGAADRVQSTGVVSRLLLVFLSEPLPGLMSPGLADSLGPESAVRVHRALVRVLLRQLSGLSDCRIRFCFTPDDAHEAVKFWILPEIMEHSEIQLDPEVAEFHPQGPGGLGERMHHAFVNAFADGFPKVGLIGTECIELSSRWIHAAFAQLNSRHDAAIGPTPRGDCHLLALQRHHPALFQDIPWGRPGSFHATLTRASDHRIPTYQLPPLPMIGSKADYQDALHGPLGPALRKAMKELE